MRFSKTRLISIITLKNLYWLTVSVLVLLLCTVDLIKYSIESAPKDLQERASSRDANYFLWLKKPWSFSIRISEYDLRDYRSIQEAIDKMPEGGVLRIPAGTYAVTETIMLRSGITLIGAGEATKLVAADDLRAHVISPKTTSIKDVTIKDLQIDGNKDGQKIEDGAIIGVSDALYLNGENIIIDNVVVHDSCGEGISLYDAKNVEIMNCRITDARSLNAGIALSGKCRKIKIEDTLLDGNGKNICITNGADIVIKNVVNSNAVYDGIEIDVNNSGISIVGGSHYGNGYSGISLAQAVSRSAIKKAKIYANDRAGISLFAAHDIAITECTIYENGSAECGYPAIALAGDDDLGCTNIKITNNRAFDDRRKQTQTFGVDDRWDPLCQNIEVANNDFKNNLEGELNFQYASQTRP